MAFPSSSSHVPNTYSWREFSGSLGDLGLFVPLCVAMAAVGGLDFGTILVAAGLMNIATGLFFRQPIPVQPMKAIAVVVITEGLSKGEVMASGLVMGLLMLLLAVTGSIELIDRRIPAALVRGIQLGVGLKLAAKGVEWVSELPLLGWDSVLVALLAGLALLLFIAREKPWLPLIFSAGFVVIYFAHPEAYAGIDWSFSLSLPSWPALPDWEAGFLRGALPQLPLTLLNSVVAVCALSSAYFPGRGIRPREMAISVALMNLLCCPFGAVPMCHGSGGLAAQYRFGSRSGGSVVMLGIAKTVVGLCFGGALLGLLGGYPKAILGPMLVFAGVELARACADLAGDKRALPVLLLTAAAIVGSNTFIGFMVGAGYYLLSSQHERRTQ